MLRYVGSVTELILYWYMLLIRNSVVSTYHIIGLGRDRAFPPLFPLCFPLLYPFFTPLVPPSFPPFPSLHETNPLLECLPVSTLLSSLRLLVANMDHCSDRQIIVTRTPDRIGTVLYISRRTLFASNDWLLSTV